MYAHDGSAEEGNTAFREAEKKYQLHYEQITRRRKGRERGVGVKPKETDLSSVLDFADFSAMKEKIVWVETAGGKAYSLKDKPGFCFIPSGVSPEEQWKLVVDALTRFTEPPATTNHTKQLGEIHGLWDAAKQGLRLSSADLSGTASGASESSGGRAESAGRVSWVRGGEGLSAEHLLSKLRWASIGPNFDWTMRQYLHQQPQQPLPQYLVDIARRCAAVASQCSGQAACLGSENREPPEAVKQRGNSNIQCWEWQNELSSVEGFEPDAALVNFYSIGDTLGGHCDDVECDLTKPIISLSLGCDAIFLLGGKTKKEAPIAMLLRSGDVVVLAGESRQCFHGVPRILSPSSAVPELANAFLDQKSRGAFMEFMRGRRINISVRETA